MKEQYKEYIFDITELLSFLFKNKFKIIIISFLFASFGLVYSYTLTERYTSSTLLKVDSSSDSTSLSVLNSVASNFGGLGLGNFSGESSKADYAIAFILSNDFLRVFVENDSFKENILAAKSFNKDSKVLNYDQEIFSTKDKTFVGEFSDEEHLFDEIKTVVNRDLSVTKNNKNQFIEIKYTHVSPEFAKEFLDKLIKDVNELNRIKELNRSNEAVDYLVDLRTKTNNNEINDSISKLTESELKKQMVANISEYFLIEPIDNPSKPYKKYFPRKLFITSVFLFLGILMSIFYFSVRFFKEDYES